MRAQMKAMEGRIETLEGQLGAANARADAATQAARNAEQSAAESASVAAAAKETAAKAASATPPAPAGNPSSSQSPIQVVWKGAPEFRSDNGWSFKPRGRLQVDVGAVNAPSGLDPAASNHLGVSTELRRAYLGFDGTMPGGFGYRFEVDLANSSVVINDMYLTYKAGKNVTLALGNQKPNTGLEDMTSDLFTSFMERASFVGAFGFERRVGLNAQYLGKTVLVQGGVFSDDPNSLNNDYDKSWSMDGRVVAMPQVAGGTLHLGGSVHWRTLNDSIPSVTYQSRPFIHTTDLRLLSAPVSDARNELGLGLEAAWIKGRFHATSETYWQKVRRVGFADPTFNGGYAEVGYMLTHDDTPYKAGVFERIRPHDGFDKGGLGAVQLNVRYDWLNLNDAGIVGGREQTAGISALWIPTDYVRFILNYGHIWVKDSPVLVNGTDSDYGVDSFGMRAQFDF
ncbi:phosphate-selective porin OprO/OprP [Novosphingobium sp. PhB165]|nr:phosphate-selective porin OprO/OprP [Novosphingobium sp. PhB165]